MKDAIRNKGSIGKNDKIQEECQEKTTFDKKQTGKNKENTMIDCYTTYRQTTLHLTTKGNFSRSLVLFAGGPQRLCKSTPMKKEREQRK